MREQPVRLVTTPGAEPLVERVPGRSGRTLGSIAIANRTGAVKLLKEPEPTAGPRLDGGSPADDLDENLVRATRSTRTILEHCLGGELPGRGELLHLMSLRDGDLDALVSTADQLRRASVGDAVTYVVNRNINFTNVCGIGCGFCAFSTGLAQDDAYFLTPQQVADLAEEAWGRGATEVCIQGGIHPTMEWTYYPEVLREIRARLPLMHCHAYSPMEIVWGAKSAGMPVGEYLGLLADAGLNSLPGTAAEILVDEVRAQLSPKKESVADWVEVITTAHAMSIPTTATIMFGHVETDEHRADHLLLLRSIQQDTGGFTEFVLLPFIHEYTPMYLEGRSGPGPTQLDSVRMHAVARLAFQGLIDNIQASWVKLGVAGVQECLQAGCNDFGGTLMEESISRLAGADHGQELTADEIGDAVRALGRIPRQRSTTYGEPPRTPISA